MQKRFTCLPSWREGERESRKTLIRQEEEMNKLAQMLKTVKSAPQVKKVHIKSKLHIVVCETFLGYQLSWNATLNEGGGG